MARPARLQFKEALYHVINRGNGRSPLFLDDEDRMNFLQRLAAVQKKTGLVLYAYALMPNHYHLLVETPEANLSRAIQQLNGTYALHFSRRHKKPGHLFQGRFKAFLVERDAYLLELSRYIHLNPVRAKMVKEPENFKWSSFSMYVSQKAHSPCEIEWNWILSLFGKNARRAARRYREFIMEGVGKKADVYSAAKGGWLLGGDSWAENILTMMKDKTSPELTGVKQVVSRPSVDIMERAVCSAFGSKPEELRVSRRGNVGRIAAALLAVDHCGLSLGDACERYGFNYFAAGQAVSRFRRKIEEDPGLRKLIGRVLSNVKV